MRNDRRARRLPILRVSGMVVLGVITTYLLLERNHAEEIGTGSRVLAEIFRGERPLSPLTWLAFGMLTLALVVSGRDRVGAPVEAHRGR
jgi:hypothetical protein